MQWLAGVFIRSQGACLVDLGTVGDFCFMGFLHAASIPKRYYLLTNITEDKRLLQS